MTYPHYLDLSLGRTLVCEPGHVYDVAPASGNITTVGADVPNDGRFVPVPDEDPSDDEEETTGHVATWRTMPSRVKE